MKYAKFTCPLTIAFEQQIYNQIKEISEQRRISMADVIREIIKKALTAPKTENSGETPVQQLENQSIV